MDQKFLVDRNEKFFYNFIESMTDKELTQKHLYYQYEKLEALRSIKNNLKFFFYLTIASIFIGVLATLK